LRGACDEAIQKRGERCRVKGKPVAGDRFTGYVIARNNYYYQTAKKDELPKMA
jgi:hypothetical protein